MRLLLDTHTFLWFIGGDAALSPYARQLIEDSTNERLLSIRHSAYHHIELIFLDLFFSDFVKQNTKPLKNGPLSL